MPFHILSTGFFWPFFPVCQQHFTWCSTLASLACFLNTFLLIFAVHLAAASSRRLTLSGVLIIYIFLFLLSCGEPPCLQHSPCSFECTFILFHLFLIPLFALLFRVSIQSTSSSWLLEIICSPFLLSPCRNGVMVPCCPYPLFVVDVYFITSSRRSDDVILLRSLLFHSLA